MAHVIWGRTLSTSVLSLPIEFFPILDEWPNDLAEVCILRVLLVPSTPHFPTTPAISLLPALPFMSPRLSYSPYQNSASIHHISFSVSPPTNAFQLLNYFSFIFSFLFLGSFMGFLFINSFSTFTSLLADDMRNCKNLFLLGLFLLLEIYFMLSSSMYIF